MNPIYERLHDAMQLYESLALVISWLMHTGIDSLHVFASTFSESMQHGLGSLDSLSGAGHLAMSVSVNLANLTNQGGQSAELWQTSMAAGQSVHAALPSVYDLHAQLGSAGYDAHQHVASWLPASSEHLVQLASMAPSTENTQGLVGSALGSGIDASQGLQAGMPSMPKGALTLTAMIFSVTQGLANGTGNISKDLMDTIIALTTSLMIEDLFNQIAWGGDQFANRGHLLFSSVGFIAPLVMIGHTLMKGFTIIRGNMLGSMTDIFWQVLKLLVILAFAGNINSTPAPAAPASYIPALFPSSQGLSTGGTFDWFRDQFIVFNDYILNYTIGNDGKGTIDSGHGGGQGAVDHFRQGLMDFVRFSYIMLAMISKLAIANMNGGLTSGELSTALMGTMLIIMPLISSCIAFVVSVLSVLILCKLSWGLLMGFAPLFILSLAYKSTAGMFRTWCNNLLYVILLQALTVWVVQYILLWRVILLTISGLVDILNTMQKFPGVQGQAMGILVGFQAAVVNMMASIVTAFMPRLVGSLTSTNAVSGFEAMGSLLGGSLEKAAGEMKGSMNKGEKSSSSTGGTSRAGKDDTLAHNTGQQEKTRNDTGKARDSADSNRGADGSRSNAAQTVPQTTGPTSAPTSTSGTQTGQGAAYKNES